MKRIDSIQTKDYIANAIRNEILSGGIKPQEELTQEGIATMLGVSRMPVREALQSLCQEGFLERLPNRHVQVVLLNKSQIETTFRMIAALEAEMIQILLERKSSFETLNIIMKKIENYRNKTDILEKQSISVNESYLEEIGELELTFHKTVVNMIDNQYIKQYYDKMLDGYVAYTIKQLCNRQESLKISETNNSLSKDRLLSIDSISLLEQIFISINDRQVIKIKEQFLYYYGKLSDILLAHWEVEASAESGKD